MALLFVSSIPDSGTTDYFINKSIELTYNQAISESSLTDNVVSLVDLSTNQNVPIVIARKSSNVFLYSGMVEIAVKFLVGNDSSNGIVDPGTTK